MFRKLFRKNKKPLVANLETILADYRGFFTVFTMTETQVLVATLQELVLVENDIEVSRYGWEEFSLARWEEKGVFTFIFHDGRPNLEFESKNTPSIEFLDTVREGIMETQVFTGVIHLPSGNEITARILRDSHRNFFVHPLPSGFENTSDQGFLYATYQRWQHKLGIDIKIGSNSIR